jgi:predicted ATPase
MDLIGRERELSLLTGRLRDRRLVTVIGPGGIGKTTLARAAAQRLAGDFALGSMLVDLTRVDSGDGVGEALAAQLGFSSFAALLNSPQDQPVLLVIDNCEHVAAAAARVVRELLESCAAPTVCATSRSPLDLPGESVVVVGPLGLPDASGGGADALSPALALFRERVVDAGGTLPDGDLDVAGELCRRLDGVPLALELAAARTRSMTPAEILARLDEPLDLLARPRYGGAHRHRSLRSTVEWSYRLLDDADARTFDALGVFAGPFTAATAHAVVADPGTDPGETLDRLDALVAASLVVAEPQGATTRYRLLHALRSYAVERLDLAGLRRATYDRYADHVVTAVLELLDRAGGRWEPATLAELLDGYENLTAALRWCIAEDAEPDRAVLLLAVLWSVIHQGHTSDVAALGERLLDRWPEPREGMWADAVATVATCRYLLGRPRDALELAERALPVAPSGLYATATLRRVMGQSHRTLGDVDAALTRFEQGAAEARARGTLGIALELDVARGLVLADLGQVDEALALVRAAHAAASAGDSPLNAVWAASAHGYVLLRRDPGAAAPVIEAALAEARRIGYPGGITAGLRTLALAHVAHDRPGDAAATLLELLAEVWRGGAVTDLQMVVDVAAVVAHRAGRPAWADLAATAGRLPVVSLLASVGHELFPLPPHENGRVLSPREASVLARAELSAVVAAAGSAGDAGDAVQPAPPPAAPELAGAARGVFRSAGEFWELGYGGRTAHLKESKGLADLARLLAAPGVEVHCLDLAAGPARGGAGGAGGSGGAAGEAAEPVIDDVARRQYEQRVRDLQAEIDEAEAFHDSGRAERARAELDVLVDHLTAALGLGGRTRRVAGTAERARSTVTQRVRATIRRIAEVHPELGRHLLASVSTGAYLSYRPERDVRWDTAAAVPPR